MALLGASLAALTLMGGPRVPVIYAVAGLTAAAFAFGAPARHAPLPALVPRDERNQPQLDRVPGLGGARTLAGGRGDRRAPGHAAGPASLAIVQTTPGLVATAFGAPASVVSGGIGCLVARR